MEVLNRSAIKREARAFIGEDTRWLKMMLTLLPYLLLTGAVSAGVSVYQTINDTFNQRTTTTTYSSGVNIIIFLLIPFGVALYGYFLNCIRGFNPTWKDPYKEGFDRYGKYLAVGFVTNFIIGLWTLLFIIPGIVKGYAYSQVNFIIHDNPNLTPKQARDISDRMTDGFKGELFVRDLSYILWYLLAAVTAGIALIYITPYMYTVSAMYYENLKSNAMASGRVSPVEFGIMPTPPYGDVPPMPGAPFAQQPPMDYNAPQQPPVTGDMGYGYGEPQPPVSDDASANAPQQQPIPTDIGSIDASFYVQTNAFTPPAPEDTFRPGTEEPSPSQPNPEQ